MKPTRIVLSILAAVAVLVAAGCGGKDDSVPVGAVAVVDGTEIAKTELDELLTRAKKSYAAQKREFPKAGTPEYQSLQTQAVAFLVQRAEYDKEVDAFGLEITDKEIDARVAQVKKTYFGDSQKKLDKQLAEQGYTTKAFREDIRSQLVSEELYSEVTANVKVTDADVKKHYDDNRSQYEVGATRDVRHILVKTKAQADDVYNQLKAGGDFAALAKKVSLDPGSKDSGGKLTISKGQTVAPFDAAAFQLDTDEISKPVKTQFGYHVIQPLGAVKPGSATPFAQVKSQIKSQLEEEKKNAEIEKWAADVKKSYDAKVSYAAGFEPPAVATTPETSTTDG
jgi:foldase protein PrsA